MCVLCVHQSEGGDILSNTIYKSVVGIAACSLALRIYEQGEVELSENECEIIRLATDNLVGILAESIRDGLPEF